MPGPGLQNPCCCDKIGFENGSSNNVMQSSPTWTAVTDLLNNPDKIAECKAVFLGPLSSFQGTQMVPNASYVSDYLQKGGRVFLAGEYAESFDPTTTNELLGAIGSSMSMPVTNPDTQTPGHLCNCDCEGYDNNTVAWPGILNYAVKMLADVDAIYHACVNNANGGTWMVQTNAEAPPDPNSNTPPDRDCSSSFTFIAVERIGKGFLILCADSDTAGDGCTFNNSDFWKAFVDNPDDQMI
jgi:hypothetical protein